MSEGHEPRFIADDREVERLAARWKAGTVLGVDTESDAFYAYREKLCLLQIADEQGIYLIDPLAVDLQLLKAPFEDPGVEIVMHAGENDVRLLRASAGIALTGLFDTQGARLILGGDQVGLAALVEEHFGVKLSKREQRSDWSRRPLKSAQLRYAAADVEHLIELRRILGAQLEAAGRWEGARRLFERIMATRPQEKRFDEQGFYKIKGYGGLDPAGRAIVRALYLAREARSERINRPPFMVLGNDVMVRIARARPESSDALGKVGGMPKASRQRFEKGILEAVRVGLQDREPPPPRRPRPPRRPSSGNGAILDALLAWRQGKAAELSVQVQVIATARDLELIAEQRPGSLSDLRDLPGIGPRWVEEWGGEVLKIVEKSIS
ncbi:MAG: HRDC domain-containing protein [Deltaproteobacteria bacterium]|nr:HRDC domain-containing protein [Deltaproteobacteria bacterium]